MKPFLFFALPLLLFSFASDRTPALTKIDALNKRLEDGGDTCYVVNFWATWCSPCVAELHYFTELDSAYKGTNVKVILVSLDFKKDISSKLVPFIEKRNIRTEVLFLDETKDNEWIPKVDGEWQGNVPATIIRHPSKQYHLFLPRETTYHELDSLVQVAR